MTWTLQALTARKKHQWHADHTGLRIGGHHFLDRRAGGWVSRNAGNEDLLCGGRSKRPVKTRNTHRRGPGVSGRLVSKSNLWKGTLWTPFWGPLLLVCYPETAVPADNCAAAGRSNVCVKESVQLAGLDLCRRAITTLLRALDLRAVDVSTTGWDKGGGSREVEGGNVEVSTPTVS
jgi:hypothetical protein